MAPVHELAFSWRSRLRIVLAMLLTFGAGVVAVTAGAPWWSRAVAVPLSAAGAYGVLDAIVFTSSWRFTPSALAVPTLASRRRAIVGDALTVELRDGHWSRLVVSGPNGTRAERINPLVSGRDLRSWWDSAPDG